MKQPFFTLLPITIRSLQTGLLLGLIISNLAPQAHARFESIFDGKTLDDWEGRSDLWKVEDGAIVGSKVGKEIEANTFLIYTGSKVRNFHLKVKLRMTGENNSGNHVSRSNQPKACPMVCPDRKWTFIPNLNTPACIIVKKTGRGIIAQRGQKVTVPAELNDKGKTTPKVTGKLPMEPVFNLSEWNEYEIIALNKRSIHIINGVVTVDVTDHDETTKLTGAISGFQLHRGPDMTIYVKDVQLSHLRGAEARETMRAALGLRVKKKMKASPEGLAVNENRATPVDKITVPEGFKVELLYSVPWGHAGFLGEPRARRQKSPHCQRSVWSALPLSGPSAGPTPRSR